MAIQARTTLATYFNTGDKPTQDQFGHLIDSALNLNDGGTVNSACDIALAGLGTLKGPLREVIRQSADDNLALSLTAAQSGALILLDDGTEAYTITLPAITAATIGVHYTFMVTEAGNGARKVQCTDDDDIFVGSVSLGRVAAIAAAGSSEAHGPNYVVAGAADHAFVFDDNAGNNNVDGAGSIINVTAIAASSGTSGGTDVAVWAVEGRVESNHIEGTAADFFTTT